MTKERSLTLMRGLAVLELFWDPATRLTTSEVAARVGVSRAAARRLLITLEELDYLESAGRHYRRGRKGGRPQETSPFSERVRQHFSQRVVALSSRFNEPCAVSVLDGLHIQFVARDQTRRIFSAPLRVGDRLNANSSASGKVLLAALDPTVLRERVEAAGGLLAHAPASITDLDALELELAEVRRLGWAKAEDEIEAGTISIGVPIFDASHQVVAGLSVASHKTRRTLAGLIELCLPAAQDTADILSNELGAP